VDRARLNRCAMELVRVGGQGIWWMDVSAYGMDRVDRRGRRGC